MFLLLDGLTASSRHRCRIQVPALQHRSIHHLGGESAYFSKKEKYRLQRRIIIDIKLECQRFSINQFIM